MEILLLAVGGALIIAFLVVGPVFLCAWVVFLVVAAFSADNIPPKRGVKRPNGRYGP